MGYEETAKHLDAEFQKLIDCQGQLRQEAATLLSRWENELEPITKVMRKHGILYRNSRLPEAATRQGIIVGLTNSGHILVIRQRIIYPVNKQTGDLCLNESNEVATFIQTADLETVKAGFEFVRGLEPMSNEIAKRNAELAAFLKEI